MVDELYDRAYREGRTQLNRDLAEAAKTLTRAVRNAFEVLNRVEYSAPWAANEKPARCD